MATKKMGMVAIILLFNTLKGGLQPDNMPPIKFTSATEFQALFQSRGDELLRLCKITPGNERSICQTWHNPEAVVVSGMRCQIAYSGDGFHVIGESGVTNVAVGSISIAANEKENRLNVFAQLALSSLPLDALSRSLSISRSLPDLIILKGSRGDLLLHKNIAIEVEGENGREIANALFEAGHGKQCLQGNIHKP
jgi:hypothetical protein